LFVLLLFVLLYWGYIVTITNVLTMYQNWIYSLQKGDFRMINRHYRVEWLVEGTHTHTSALSLEPDLMSHWVKQGIKSKKKIGSTTNRSKQ
jgi:hypothetical protein